MTDIAFDRVVENIVCVGWYIYFLSNDKASEFQKMIGLFLLVGLFR